MRSGRKCTLKLMRKTCANEILCDRMTDVLGDKHYDEALKLLEEIEAAGASVYLLNDPRLLRLAILTVSGKQPAEAVELGKTLLNETHAEAVGAIPGVSWPSSLPSKFWTWGRGANAMKSILLQPQSLIRRWRS